MVDLGKFAMRLAALALAFVVPGGTPEDARAQQTASSNAAQPNLVYADQGWSEADRDAFYTTSQGSVLIRYIWFRALRRLDVDEAFGGDKLQRYGYIRNERPKRNFDDLPIGFVVVGDAATGQLGMTCAACHTAQVEYETDGRKFALRLDGAPANADFQQFLTDLAATARATVQQPTRFNRFAHGVLGMRYTSALANDLKTEFGAWAEQFGDFMDRSLPATPWGPGRLDAFGMIFNRVAGRDLDKVENFRVADAPVSYPFLWNAAKQDRTQWNGAVPNGLFVHALGRNTGEVFGVFGRLEPKLRIPRIPPAPPLVTYLGNLSVDFGGLQTLEEKIVKLRPPPWPRAIFGVDETLAKQGEGLFSTHCKACHSDAKSTEVPDAWLTPVKAVGTDPKMVENAKRKVDPGILEGALAALPPVTRTLGNPASAQDVLAVTVVGTLFEQLWRDGASRSRFGQTGIGRAVQQDVNRLLPGQKFNPARIGQVVEFMNKSLRDLFTRPPTDTDGAAYEARALHGIWATAPYLHNGSVPSLWELLTPPAQRTTTFMTGSRVFDPRRVGYVTDQSPFKTGTFVADPANANGNGNGGHRYGTDLTENERWAIIEYLKTY